MKTRLPDNTMRRLSTGILLGLLATTLAGCTAAAFGKPSLALEVQSAVSSGSVFVQLVDGTAILSGRVPETYDSMAAERVALRYEGVDRVINHIWVVR
jgi:hypothetical protein